MNFVFFISFAATLLSELQQIPPAADFDLVAVEVAVAAVVDVALGLGLIL